MKGDGKKRTESTKTEEVPSVFRTAFLAIHIFVVLAGIVWFVYYANPGQSDLKWWQTTIIYQIYPRSFKDSNGDGVGDLEGIISKLDHFVYLNVKAIWLSPFYRSPMKDFGYDISNHTDVDSIFGTLSDFDDLVREAHSRGIKVMIDYVPNHVSDQHPWFQESLKGRGKYKDYFMWSDGKTVSGSKQPPNNWLSVFGGECWHWVENHKQFYYHAFTKEQPDLNYRNPDVVKDMNDVVRFWLDRGVDGIRVDAIIKLFEAENVYQDEPRSNLPGIPEFQYEYLNHIHTENLPEIGDIMRGWRKIMDEYEAKDGKSRVMMVESYYSPAIRNKYYDYGSMPFNSDLVDGINADCGGDCIRDILEAEYTNLPTGAWPNFVIGNHDRKRVSKKFGAEFVNAFNMLLLTVKGTPTTYYGEEIGMEEIDVRFEDTRDPWGINFGKDRYKEFSRDPARSPMQWDGSKQAGFTTSNKPWLPVHPNYRKMNVDVQKKDKGDTPMKIYQQLALLREVPAFQKPEVEYVIVNANIISYIRGTTSTGRYLVVINFGHTTSTDSYYESPVNTKVGTVVVTTGTFSDTKFNVGSSLSLMKLSLKPGQGLVVKL